MAKITARVLYWFRTDLRLHSSPALHTAINLEPEVLYPVWVWDPEYVYAHKVGVNRFSFLLDSMSDLSRSLTTCNPQTKLNVVRGSPQQVMPFLFKEWRITHLVYEKDSAGYAAARDNEIKAIASDMGVEVIDVLGHTLYDPWSVVEANGGKATMSLSSWHAAVKGLPAPSRPLPVPNTLPPLGHTTFSNDTPVYQTGSRRLDLNSKSRVGEVTCYDTLAGPSGNFEIPTLEELGLPEATSSVKGGETEALRRLRIFCEDSARVATFAKPKTSPAEFDPPTTTLLSPYLKFGCLGVNEFLWRVRDTITEWKTSKANANESKEPVNLEGQLAFREMYYTAECAQGQVFGQIRGNSICRFVDWHLQNKYNDDGSLIIPRPPGNAEAEQTLLAWKEGRTGFPWIDAIMRQLRQEGWIHHLARHSVACFLTRGQCYISWERGAEVFDEYLIDWDPCSNPGNWMWLSASAFYNMYYRIYSVTAFPKKWDKSGKLVRKFCPELSKFPDKYIYCPHEAPLDIQKKAECIIGQDYPNPILDEKLEKEKCLARMKAAYKLGFHGADKEVMDGSAHERLKAAYQDAVSAIDAASGDQGTDNKRSPTKRKNESEDHGAKRREKGSKDHGSMERYVTRQRKR